MQIIPTTVTITTLSIEVNVDEAREILVDPTPFQSKLRSAMAELGRQAYLKRGGPKPRSKDRAPKGLTPGAAREKVPCGKCGKPIARYQMGRHSAKCKGRATANAATSSN